MHAHINARYIYSSVSGISVVNVYVSAFVFTVVANGEDQVFCGATLTVDMTVKEFLIKYECIM
jgi:hypothetical protein